MWQTGVVWLGNHTVKKIQVVGISTHYLKVSNTFSKFNHTVNQNTKSLTMMPTSFLKETCFINCNHCTCHCVMNHATWTQDDRHLPLTIHWQWLWNYTACVRIKRNNIITNLLHVSIYHFSNILFSITAWLGKFLIQYLTKQKWFYWEVSK